MRILRFVLSLCLLSLAAFAANGGGYHLFPRDVLKITVHGEEDMKDLERRIDGNGNISLPLVGAVPVQGLTATDAGKRIELVFIEQEILVHPQVSVTVSEYFPREISVLGQVNKPGKVEFPIEAESLSVVEAVSRAGGLTRIAKSDSVRVTRRDENGAEKSETIDLQRMIDGRGGVAPFLVLPGDVIFIPERVF